MGEIALFFRLFLSALLGGIIGLEREAHGRAAGLRDHMLVCVGSALASVLSIFLYNHYAGSDPSRIMSQVISGIGFLGAGAILRFRASVAGLTTAASLWVVAVIGLVVGAGFYVAALIATLLVWSSLFLLRTLVERYLIRRDQYRILEVEIRGTSFEKLQQVRDILAEYNTEIKDLELGRLEGEKARVQFNLKLLSPRDEAPILKELGGLEGVLRVLWK